MIKSLHIVLFSWLIVVCPAFAAENEQQSKLAESLSWLWTNIQDVEALAAFVVLVVGLIWGIRKLPSLFKKANPASPHVDPEHSLSQQEIESDYYAELSERCQRYDLGSFRDSKSFSEQTVTQVHLSDVYVDLKAHKITGKSEDHTEQEQGGIRDFHGEKSELLLDILQDQTRSRLVVRGDVGSGKSSFINYLCHSIVESHQGRSTSPAVPQHWLRRPVIRLLLREIGSQVQQEDAEGQLLSFIKQRVISQLGERCKTDDVAIGEWWDSFWSNFKSNGILILDGLDEVSGSYEEAEGMSRRQVLLNGIHHFARNTEYRGISLIATSRNHAYGGDDALPDFELFQLDPLNISDRYSVFIRHWYERVAYTEEEKLSYQDDARDLLNNIAKSSSLPALTETPLLLTLILVLDKAEIGLPDSRAELYQNAVNLLLDRWNKQLIQYSESLSVEEQHALQVLKQDVNILRGAVKFLAYKTYQDEEKTLDTNEKNIQDRGIVFPVEVVNEALKEQLEQHTGLGFAHQNACRYFLRFRSQLLVAAGEGISFVHKSFHEYLAAAYIMDLDMSRDELLWQMTETPGKRDWWQKVFLFALNIGGAEYVMKLMKAHVLSQQVAVLTADEMQNHLDTLSLFSRASLENNLEFVVSRTGQRNTYLQKAYSNLQTHLAMLWERTDLSVLQRAQLGRIAGRSGDVRKGMTFQRNDDFIIRYIKTETQSFPVPDFEWREIPPGEFTMGTQGEEGYADEKPPQTIEFKRSFHMTQTAVTNAQYQAFIDAGGYKDESIWRALPEAAYQWWQGGSPGMDLIDTYPKKNQDALRQFYKDDRERKQPRYWQSNRWNLANHPVVGVSWFEALAYCEWLSRNRSVVLPASLLDRGCHIRLPSEDEWEYAARGKSRLKYSWGDEEKEAAGNHEKAGLQRTNAAGVFTTEINHGLYDMSGNVWEWTSSRWGKSVIECDFHYGENYMESRNIQNDLNPLEFRITRGGSWFFTSVICRCAVRSRNHPYDRDYALGFRVAGVE